MLFGSPRLKVIGTGRYLPDEVIPNSYFEGRDLWNYDGDGKKIGEAIRLTSAKIVDQTGIYERRRAGKNETPSSMAVIAARRALEMADVSPNSLVGIVFASVTEQRNFPSGAAKIQKELEARNVQFAYDMQNACASFPEALMQAESRALRVPGNYLVVAGETLTRLAGEDDINSDLFGDGAGAVVLTTSNGIHGLSAGYSRSDPFDGKLDYIGRDSQDKLRMPAGPKVFKLASRSMVQAMDSLQEEMQWGNLDVGIIHQANGNIIRATANGVGAKVITDASPDSDGPVIYQNIQRYGNMSEVTCPIALDECLRGGVIRFNSSRVNMVGVGSGISVSAVAIQF